MIEGQPVDEDRRHRINERQRAGQRRRQFLDGAVEQHVHQPGMHHTQGRKAGPGLLALRQLMPSQGRQQQNAGQQLNQRDQMRRRSAETFDDQCRDRIEQRRTQRQGDAQ